MEEKRIKKQDVEYLSELARIELTEQEKEKLCSDLEKILNYVSQLERLDTEKVEGTYHVLPVKNVFREDKVEKRIPEEDILKTAPARKENFYKVPKII